MKIYHVLFLWISGSGNHGNVINQSTTDMYRGSYVLYLYGNMRRTSQKRDQFDQVIAFFVIMVIRLDGPLMFGGTYVLMAIS